ncbi:hypothetical protein C7974DRAFT_12400 [Boeremia exigua]|uniref:uncharacterized protein n=1 Tax=Boeremia exigua TaxID=749465 RepID=UPI001E8DE100|nr:uncharacterized protein C7974DRAFT_12400 [Boeremia exigua]KAH6644005.1 hypothetical protein C7974DRAFT_12400 [Boeremia exigua]
MGHIFVQLADIDSWACSEPRKPSQKPTTGIERKGTDQGIGPRCHHAYVGGRRSQMAAAGSPGPRFGATALPSGTASCCHQSSRHPAPSESIPLFVRKASPTNCHGLITTVTSCLMTCADRLPLSERRGMACSRPAGTKPWGHIHPRIPRPRLPISVCFVLSALGFFLVSSQRPVPILWRLCLISWCCANPHLPPRHLSSIWTPAIVARAAP